jgi:ribosomal protein L37AE/L43A
MSDSGDTAETTGVLWLFGIAAFVVPVVLFAIDLAIDSGLADLYVNCIFPVTGLVIGLICFLVDKFAKVRRRTRAIIARKSVEEVASEGNNLPTCPVCGSELVRHEFPLPHSCFSCPEGGGLYIAWAKKWSMPPPFGQRRWHRETENSIMLNVV